MSDTNFNVDTVAKLARLKINPELVPQLQNEMDAIVQYVEMLTELDVSNIEPMAHAIELSNVLRNDQPTPPYPKDVMLDNAPDTINNELIKVPQVLPGEGMP